MEDSMIGAQTYLSFIEAFSNKHPSEIDYNQFKSLYKALNIAEIRWQESQRGIVVQDIAVYETPHKKAIQPFVRNYICNDVLQRQITIYRIADTEPWSKDMMQQIRCFCEINFICSSNYILRSHAATTENIDRDTGIATMPVLRRHMAMLCSQGLTDQFAAMYINLKNCKLINKNYGYAAGTKLMRAFALTLQDMTDQQNNEIVIRLGGDNYIALIRKENLASFLEQITEVRVSVDFQGRTVHNTFSARAGVWPIEDKHSPFDIMMNNIGRAISLTRIPPFHDIVYFDAAIERTVLRRNELEVQMESALASGEFLVLYQPKVSAVNNCLVGAEALVRWKHGDEMISPAEFIPLSEQNGFVSKIDYFVLDQVCAQLRKWMDAEMDPVPVSVNFSRVHFEEEDVAERIFEVVNRHNVPPCYIEIEFTETVSYNEKEKLLSVIEQLKAKGLAVSMDDFGAGYSSLSLLQDLNFDVIKIDRSLCDVSNNRQSVVLEHVIRLARALNMCVVCEGVESEQTYGFIKQAGCDMIQGFLFDRPIPLDQFEQRLRNKQYELK